MTLVPMHDLLLATSALSLIAAGAHDVAARTIPHWTVVGVACSGLALHLADGGLSTSLLAAVSTFCGTALLWRAGWLGGGDAKLLGGVALLVPPASFIATLNAIAIAGAALALLYLAARGRLSRPSIGSSPLSLLARCWRAERFRLGRGGPLPYGVAIAFGALLNLWSVHV